MVLLLSSGFTFAQVEEEETKSPDTTRVNLKRVEILIIEKLDSIESNALGEENPEETKPDRAEAHWAGLDFGFSMLMNQQFAPEFTNNPYWETDAARSQVWNLNLLEHKFRLYKDYIGITTGLGFSFTSAAFTDNYLLLNNADTLFAEMDTTLVYSKNKLKASYLTVPLLLEFCTNADANKSFYLATGVVGGVRIASKIKRAGEFDGKDFTQTVKGIYGLNPFKLDATVRMGFSSFGAFASYSLLPLFDTGKTVEVYPLTFGLSMNF